MSTYEISALLLLLLGLLQWHVAGGNDLSRVSLDELQQFKQCVAGKQRTRLTECLGRSALNFIQRFDEHENVSFVDELVTVKSESAASRSLLNVLDTDPVDFRGILENAGAVMGQRSLEWHMDGLYPGLMFKIGPTADANSVAEFVLAEGSNDGRQFAFEDAPTGRLLAKQYLVPFLLGLKFNLVALVPLLFAGICLLLKKSLFFAKLAIYISSFLGMGGVLGSLGGLGGLGGAGVGAGFGGLGGLGGFGFGPRPIGHFPGKTSVYGQYDELHHQYNVQDPLPHAPPYKRSERKVRFEQPRESSSSSQLSEDRFYDYERQQRSDSAEAAKSTMAAAQSMRRSYQQGPSPSWQVVDVRAL